jgi:hypothetical protein
MQQLKTPSLVIGLLLMMTACSSNPVKPPPLPLPDCPNYQVLTQEELRFIAPCSAAVEVCRIRYETLEKLLNNHLESITCLKEYRAIVGSTQQ